MAADTAGLPPGAVLRLRRIGPGSGLPPTSAMLRLLDDAERGRAARTIDVAQSVAFVAGRYLLRALAADLLGTRPGLLVSCFTCPVCGPGGVPDHGRPAYLLRGERVPLALSLSRAGGFVLLGAIGAHGTPGPVGEVGPVGVHGAHGTPGPVGEVGPVGVHGTSRTVRLPGTHGGLCTPTSPVAGPVAPPGLGVDLTAIAAADFDGFDDVALTPGERSMVRGLPAGDRVAARARLWARKEALVKASGTGFTDRGPDAVEVLRERSITDLPSVGGEALEPLGLVAAVAVDP